jgi:hypothetical protein
MSSALLSVLRVCNRNILRHRRKFSNIVSNSVSNVKKINHVLNYQVWTHFLRGSVGNFPVGADGFCLNTLNLTMYISPKNFFFFFVSKQWLYISFFFLQKEVHDNYVYISTIKKYRSVHASGFVLIHHTITKNDLTACD